MQLMNNSWYIVLESADLKRKPLKLKRFGKTLVMWRDESGKVNCVDDRCPHRGASLSLGKVKDGCVTCPFHGIAFNGEGDCKKIPFVDEERVCDSLKVEAYLVTERYGLVWLWHGDNFEGQEPKLFNNMERGYAFHSMNKNWNTHYTRAIENQLDYYHLPFVHSSTIGRGFKPASSSKLSEALEVTFENDVISAAMKTGRASASRFRYMFPNAWQLRLSPFAFLFVAFCPVDEENTMMILRSYIKGKQFRGLKNLMLKSAPLFNYKILSEDETIVVTQTPKAISKDMDEHLLALDKPIVLFRKHYFERLKTSLNKSSSKLVPFRKV